MSFITFIFYRLSELSQPDNFYNFRTLRQYTESTQESKFFHRERGRGWRNSLCNNIHIRAICPRMPSNAKKRNHLRTASSRLQKDQSVTNSLDIYYIHPYQSNLYHIGPHVRSLVCLPICLQCSSR